MPPVKPVDPRLSQGATRRRMVSRVVHARRHLEHLPRAGGRAWINGREVGGPNARFGHLAQTHD